MARTSSEGKAQVGTAPDPARHVPSAAASVQSNVWTPDPSAAGGDRRRAAFACGWCGTAMEPKARGRTPKLCSASCRQRAWEQARAVTSAAQQSRSSSAARKSRCRCPRPGATGPACWKSSPARSMTAGSTTETSTASPPPPPPCWRPWGAGPMCVAEGPVRADGCARENVPQRRGDTSTTLSPHLLSSAAHRPARLASVRPGSFEGDAAGIDVTGGVT
jgi:hypothetical protein